MKTKECKSGISMIKPTSFYYSESEKIKLNWKYKIDEKAIADFSIYLSKKMKDIYLTKTSG
jgi:hypothetical protein